MHLNIKFLNIKFWKYIVTCIFVVPVFRPWFHSDTFWSFNFFCSFFMSNNIIYQNWCYYIFTVRRYLFSVNTFFIVEEYKFFMKVFHVSWNSAETIFMEFSERKASQCIRAFRSSSTIFRSSHRTCSMKKALKICNMHTKTPCSGLFLIKV